MGTRPPPISQRDRSRFLHSLDKAVRATLGEVISRYGRIDGIIHGAGVLRDGLLSQMTLDALSMVTDVKFLGAWNLFSAAAEAGRPVPRARRRQPGEAGMNEACWRYQERT